MNTNSSSPTTISTLRPWHWVALSLVTLLAVFLNFYQLEQEGFGNLYYSATVQSMSQNWKNFFFASFDPAGFVSVDKPPLGFWIQVISVKLIGFNGWSLILPQALAGVLAVPLIFHLVRRVFGPSAGVLAALALTITPISVAANRNNTLDSQLVLTSLLAAWAGSLAAEKGKLRWLLLCAMLVGIGFNIKMLQAYLVLPAFYLLYLLAPPLPWWKRLLHLVLATVVLLVVSLAWAFTVDLTHPDARPYVGSSKDNTVLELIIGHNGMNRLLPGGLRRILGQNNPPQNAPGQIPGGLQPLPDNPPLSSQPNQPGSQPGSSSQTGTSINPPYGYQANMPGNPFSQEISAPGMLRLFSKQLGGQASWLLLLAGVGTIAASWRIRMRSPLDPRHQALLLWSMWTLPQLVFFSVANLFHRYYLNMLSPGIAVLVGAGIVALWQDYLTSPWKGWLLPPALLATAVVETRVMAPFTEWAPWMAPLILGLALLSSLGLVILRLLHLAHYGTSNNPHEIHPSRSLPPSLPLVIALIGIISLFIAPFAWSLTPLMYGGDSGLPYASPALGEGMIDFRPESPLAQNDHGIPFNQPLLNYLLENYHGERFLAATMRANDAAPLILASGQAVMALGGFSGGDPILTTDELADLVAAGEVRFFYGMGTANSQPSDLFNWITTNCTVVPAETWSGGRVNILPGWGRAEQLYDCGIDR